MSNTVAKKQILRIRYDRDDDVVVHPPDDDVYVVTTKEAVEAIQQWASPYNEVVAVLADHLKTLKEQSESLLKKLHDWSKEHSDSIHRADFRVLSLDDFLFVVMQKNVPYNSDLCDELTDLDIEIANDADFGLITLNVLSIPRCSPDAAQAFIDWEHNICIADFTNNA
jgi:hypothetical protein